jgi:hypothetical protein
MDITLEDFRLREDSPCIDAGVNLVGFSSKVTNEWGHTLIVAYAHDPTDILGNTRFVDGNGDGVVAWDIGAYEFNSYKPPRFLGAPQLTSSGWKLTLSGAVNKWVQVQRSSNLRDWVDIWPPVFMGSEGIQEFIDCETGEGMRFYRAVVE